MLTAIIIYYYHPKFLIYFADVARAYVVPERPGDCRRLPKWFRCPSRTFYPLSGSGSLMAGLVARTELGNRRVPNTREYGLTESV